MKKILTSMISLGLAATSSATIINIPADYPTIQQGIDASADGDTVLVQPGTYVENINFNGHNIVLGSQFLTTGDTSYISTTIIDGDSAGTVVIFENGEDSTTVINGFTIQNGYDYRYGGGGIRCYYTDPKILNNIIANNVTIDFLSPGGYGGGIYCNHSKAIIEYNTVKFNMAEWAGGGIYASDISNIYLSYNNISENMGSGIYCYASAARIFYNYFNGNSGGGVRVRNSYNAIIHGNIITGNSSIYDGGGVYCKYGGGALISNNIISNNYAEGNGGGIEVYESTPKIFNCIISDNIAEGYGGGLNFWYSSQLMINNSVYRNTAGYGGGLCYANGSTPTIRNTIFWADTALIESHEIYTTDSLGVDIAYSNIYGGGWSGEGNISIDPFFRDPDNGDFHLMSTACGDSVDSPCIDAGDPNILDSLLDCDWGLGGIRSDMGAYGGGDSLITAIWDNIPALPEEFMLLQNYPNPFNAQTTIRFVISKTQRVELTVYDLLGRQVETLFDDYMRAGAHAVTYDASRLSSGVYFVRLESGESSKSIKMILIK